MYSKTKRTLEDFDNQHDFERMSADILNALGYSSVEPMAPGGGADGGQDIKFKEGDSPGIAFVTLEKKIQDKFNRDLAKQNTSEGVIALFCNVEVTPKMKLKFAKAAIMKGYRLEIFDLERLRSLLDSSLKDVRQRYLHIDDEIAATLRSEVAKLLRYPDAQPDSSTPPTLLEKMLINKLPRRLFELLLRYEEKDVFEVPEIGAKLHNHLTAYYKFSQIVSDLEKALILKIGQLVKVRFREGWVIYYKYIMMRFGGGSQDEIIARGNFLNYDITWDDAERVFNEISADNSLSAKISKLLIEHNSFVESLTALTIE